MGTLVLFCFSNVQEDEIVGSPVLAPKAPNQDALKDEPADNISSKPASSVAARGTPSTSKSGKGKRKLNSDDAKPASNAPSNKKGKTENVYSFIPLFKPFYE